MTSPRLFVGASPPLTLNDPGLYVFVCKLHPFMLAAAIVDDPATTGLDLGNTDFNLHLISYKGLDFPASSDLATRLLRAFFLITNPANYQDRSVDGTLAGRLSPRARQSCSWSGRNGSS